MKKKIMYVALFLAISGCATSPTSVKNNATHSKVDTRSEGKITGADVAKGVAIAIIPCAGIAALLMGLK